MQVQVQKTEEWFGVCAIEQECDEPMSMAGGVECGWVGLGDGKGNRAVPVRQ